MENKPEKFIPRRQYNPVRKHNSPCCHAKKVAAIATAVIIFIEATMERPNPPFLLTVVREKEEETKSSIQKTLHGEN
jgi:hypothetical protein